MSKYSKLKISDKNKYRGFREEALFAACVRKYKGYTCRAATNKEDRFRHIDIFISNGISVDIKAQKRVNNSDKDFSTDFTWVEFLNVNGNLGWVDGFATHIAYALGDHYKIFHRESLKVYVASRVLKDSIMIKDNFPEPYIYYRRPTLKDKIVLVSLKDLEENVPYFFLERDENILDEEHS